MVQVTYPDAGRFAPMVTDQLPGPQLLPDFFNTDTTQARASLESLRPLDADVVIPGHGPAFQGTPNQAVDLALRHT